MRSWSVGGQAGLAIAWHLKREGLRFVVLEAGSELGHTRRACWNSLKLFTPAQYDGELRGEAVDVRPPNESSRPARRGPGTWARASSVCRSAAT